MREPPQSGYRLLEHTADAGVLAWGPDPGSAFAQATGGMYAIVLGTDPAEWQPAVAPAQVQIEVQGEDWSDLLVNWLAELVFRFDTEGLVARAVTFQRCEPPACLGTVDALYLGPDNEAGGVGIKAVTYHQLQVRIEPARTEVQVIFDI